MNKQRHTVTFDKQVVECESEANLRQVLLRANLPLYTPTARVVHCRGLGTCGTCALRIRGNVSPMTRIERWRLDFPPHIYSESLANKLRLACQCKVLGDLQLEKLMGMWGNSVFKDDQST